MKVGEVFVVVEVMKMENVFFVECDVVVGKIFVKVGDSLVVDEVIMEFE